MRYRNMNKALGKKGSINVLEELSKVKSINESPQHIPPLNQAGVEKIKSWIKKIHDKLGENGVDFEIENVYGTSVIHLKKVRIPGYSGRKNVLYTVYQDQINFFSLYEIIRNLKGISGAVTQFLVYRDSSNNHNGISSISLNRVSWDIVFPITRSFLCDKQQTGFGRKSWEYIVEQAFQKGLKVYVYDSKLKFLTEMPNFEFYLLNINTYYGSSEDYQKYQILIREE